MCFISYLLGLGFPNLVSSVCFHESCGLGLQGDALDLCDERTASGSPSAI